MFGGVDAAAANPHEVGVHELAVTATTVFERRHNSALLFDSEDAFVQALVKDIPPAPEQQAAIIAANRSGRPLAEIA